MSDPCEDARQELATAKNRLEDEQDTYEERERDIRSARTAADDAYGRSASATRSAKDASATVETCKGAARAAGLALQDAESNYHEINREAHLGELSKVFNAAKVDVEDAEKVEKRLWDSAGEYEAEFNSKHAAIETAEGVAYTQKGEVAKAEAWVASAQRKVDAACP